MAASTRQGRWARGLGTAALLGMGIWLGQMGQRPLAAEPAAKPPAPLPAPFQNASPTLAQDQRVVAYIHGNVALTREEFGEYLIQRYGRDRVELFVNKRIIEYACAQKGIEVGPAEIRNQIMEDMKLLGISLIDFKNQMLRRYGKTMYEWEEDVIRPRLLLGKLCRDRIQISDEDLRKTFENKYGKKVQAKIIIWPKAEAKIAQKMYDDCRKDEVTFNRLARQQKEATLASREGLVEPIARWSVTGDNTLEDEAFKLQKDEVSKLIETPVGLVVIRCIGFVEPVKGVDFEKVKPELLKEAVDKKLSVEIPKFCEAMKLEAKPHYVFEPARLDRKLAETKIEEEIRGIEQAGAKTDGKQ